MEASAADFAALLASFRSSSSDDELTFEIPAAWLEPASEAALWAHCARDSAFDLELRLTSALLTKLLVQNKYMKDSTFVAWPSRDRHQLWATLWLACRLVPGRAYARDELTALLVRRSDVELATPALLASMLADVERRGLIEPVETGYVLSTAKLKFVLDGDKLFALRACASGRPWWQLPLQAQYVAAPRCAAPPPLATTFRCVLLDAADDANASITARFVAAGGEVHDANTRDVWDAPAGRYAALLARCAAPTRCLFVEVRAATAEERVPPFAVDCSVGGDDAWVLLYAQPMPSAEEIGNDGRGAVRAALPFAVPVEAPPARVSEQLAGQQLVDGGVVKRWPTKQKQQAAVALWLALQLVRDRSYSELEIDWLIATRFSSAKPPDTPTVKKELERHALVAREPGGGGFVALADGLEKGVAKLVRD